MNDIPLLSLILLVPLLAAGIIWLRPTQRFSLRVALAAAVLDLLLALAAVAGFDAHTGGFQFVERQVWIASLNVHYLLGVDGISLLFLPATALLFGAVVLASWNRARRLPALYFSLLLMQLSATQGVFMALDTVLFFLCWELSLVPLYFLVSLWGVGEQRVYAATKYTLVMFAGGIPLLLGFVLLAFNHASVTGAGVPGGLSFDLSALLGMPMPHGLEVAVFLLLLAGFAVKTPLFPLHTWLPVAAMEGPVAVTALLVGLKLGAYGIIRFAIPLAPDVAREMHWLLAGLGTLGLLYGAVAALAQTNLRRMLAYASLSHVGLVVLGIASYNAQGLQGALLQLLNFSLAAGGLFLLVGFLHARTGTTELHSLGGVHRAMPRFAGLLLLFSLGSLGVPGTLSFPAELLILLSALQTHTGAGLAALGAMALAAAYTLGSYRRAALGPVTHAHLSALPDLVRREYLIAAVLACLMLLFGLFPGLLLEPIHTDAARWVARVGG